MTEGKQRVTSRTQGLGAQDMSGFSHGILQMQTMNRHAVSKLATSANPMRTEGHCGSDGACGELAGQRAGLVPLSFAVAMI